MANKKRRSNGKYVFRRLMVLVVVLVLGVAAGVYIGTKAAGMLSREQTPPAPSPEPTAEPSPTPEVSAAPVGGLPEASAEPAPTPAPLVDLSAWNLILVNPREAIPDDFTVELEAIVGKYQVDKRIADNVRRMVAKAKEDGISLIICSAHRTQEYQEKLFNDSVSQYMGMGKTQEEAIALAGEYRASPGYSEHQTGLAVDIVTQGYENLDEGYAETPAAKWLVENAAEYGFILRYPKDKTEITKINFEPWHYRYVGEPAAKEIMEQGLCLEEYIYIRELEAEDAAKAAQIAEPSSSGSESSAPQ